MCFYRMLVFTLLTGTAGLCQSDTSQPATSVSTQQVSTAAQLPQQQYQLGLNYLLGRNGVSRSTEKAAHIFKSLAEQNWSSAQHMLGNMYMKGKGVEQNNLLAYKWLSLASRNNLRLAESIQSKRKQLYSQLQNSLSPQALNKVNNWIAEWQPTSQPVQAN